MFMRWVTAEGVQATIHTSFRDPDAAESPPGRLRARVGAAIDFVAYAAAGGLLLTVATVARLLLRRSSGSDPRERSGGHRAGTRSRDRHGGRGHRTRPPAAR